MKVIKFFYQAYIIAYNIITGFLPKKTAAFIDYYVRPGLRHFFGPLNDQIKRQELWFELISNISFNTIVETGTFLGETAEFFSKNARIPVYSVENNARYFYFSGLRLRRDKNVHVFLNDSREFLKKLAKDGSFPKKSILFYLDAHWQKDLPLKEEVDIIRRNWSESLIIIDDFQVPEDSGYSFDNYGRDKELSLRLFQAGELEDFAIFWPKANSREETGKKRGCIILVTKDNILDRVNKLHKLRSS